jgi:hypothetical protein
MRRPVGDVIVNEVLETLSRQIVDLASSTDQNGRHEALVELVESENM